MLITKVTSEVENENDYNNKARKRKIAKALFTSFVIKEGISIFFSSALAIFLLRTLPL